MGHYVTAYCSAHGEVDMDDSLAFCPDCYEVTPKGALAEARAEIERLRESGKRIIENEHARTKECLRLREERAELEADVVWAVENGAREVRNEHRGKPGCRVIALAFDESNSTVDCDGTSADILRAVREARNGVS